MTTQPAVSVDGDEDLARTTRAAADDLADMDSANRAIGELVRARAASAAPKLTGALAGSVRASATATEIEVVSDLVYAPVINNGWPGHNISAQPFMTSALNAATATIVDRYADETSQAVSHIHGT